MKRALLVLLLAGCATTANYEKILASWVGQSESDLVRTWGPPTGVYESGGLRMLTYDRSAQNYAPGTAPSYQTQVIGNQVFTRQVGGSSGYTVNRACTTNFEIKDGRVVNWRYEGNACTARE